MFLKLLFSLCTNCLRCVYYDCEFYNAARWNCSIILSELRSREQAERAKVEALERQLQSRADVDDEFQQPLRDLEQRLSEVSFTIKAKREEAKSLDAELQKTLATSDGELSKLRKRVDRKR